MVSLPQLLSGTSRGEWPLSPVRHSAAGLPPSRPSGGGQGILFSTTEILKTPLDLVRLWLHEAERVYGDKMVDEKDQDTLRRVTIASTKKFFDVSLAAVLLRSPDAPVGRLPRAGDAHTLLGSPWWAGRTTLAPTRQLARGCASKQELERPPPSTREEKGLPGPSSSAGGPRGP